MAEQAARRDWRDTLSTASDFALLGIAVSVLCAGVVTTGAALATGSAATAYWYQHRTMPPLRELGTTFLRALVPGLAATATGAAIAGVLAVDQVLLVTGRVPGGWPVTALGTVVAALVTGTAALALVRVGELGGTGWWSAARFAVGTATHNPLWPVALFVVVAIAVTIGALVPVTAPVLVGFALFALHVVARRIPG